MHLVRMAHWRPVLLQTPPCCRCYCWACCLLSAINRTQSATPPNEHDPLQTKLSTTSHCVCVGVCARVKRYSWPCCFDHWSTANHSPAKERVCTCVCIRPLLSFVAKYRQSNFPSCLGRMMAARLANSPPSIGLSVSLSLSFKIHIPIFFFQFFILSISISVINQKTADFSYL